MTAAKMLNNTIKDRVVTVSIGLLTASGLIWLMTAIPFGTDYGPRIQPTFYDGQMVRMRAFGSTGMVVWVSCPFQQFGSHCRYDVRFPAMQLRTDVKLFGPDGPIEFAPVALVRGIREFELEPVR